jgi:RNA 3'-terminal phosphate cyclase (ATP)
MITIDGSLGEGGGQMLRSSLALAIVTGQKVHISKIRARRRKPGLMRQHLTCVNAAAAISQAEVEGAELGSREVRFHPGTVTGGEYAFRIGTAGSTSLVLQTVLPPLLNAESRSRVTFEGGTHNSMAPPFDFLERAFLPIINQLGPTAAVRLERPGFYPAGGGLVELTVEPSHTLGPLMLVERGRLVERRCRALLAHLPNHIGERECSVMIRSLQWPESCTEIVQFDEARCPGNALSVELEFENVTEVFTGFGEQKKRAETVAREVLSELKRYRKSDAPVGEHLADQLLLPLAIGAFQGTGGGVFRTLGLSQHSQTHIDVIRAFMDVTIEVEKCGRAETEVRIGTQTTTNQQPHESEQS